VLIDDPARIVFVVQGKNRQKVGEKAERTITFRVEARDEVEAIGSGIHQRVVVSVARFDERVQRKVRGER
jgi:predicted thioesterase